MTDDETKKFLMIWALRIPGCGRKTATHVADGIFALLQSGAMNESSVERALNAAPRWYFGVRQPLQAEQNEDRKCETDCETLHPGGESGGEGET
ncbi:MAG: hypothetical protein AAFS03_08715 [Pseudomonadota bacterium]